ncbi:nicotinate-nucleotide adenylyltransferase [Roseivivax sp. CAU 1753]
MSIIRSDIGLTLPPGLRVGLLGGSFDPAHAGHVAISQAALHRFGLDRVVWLVSPGNPLKAHGPAPMPDRLRAARALVARPRVVVSDIEARIGTRYTADTIGVIQRLFPQVRFTWLMGADNLAQLHLWQDWQAIMARVPVGVLARPGARMAARRSVAARRFARARIPASQARLLPWASAPAWCFVNMPMSDLSSTAIRARHAGQGA